jgi:hypothetical protein
MAMREAHPQALALAAAAMAAGHVGRRPGLVDKDKACRIEIELAAKPVRGAASGCPGGPVRWHGRSFFPRHAVAFEEAVQARNRDRQGRCPTESARSSSSVMSRLASQSARMSVCAFLDMMRAHVAALGLRFEVANIAPLCMPTDGR